MHTLIARLLWLLFMSRRIRQRMRYLIAILMSDLKALATTTRPFSTGRAPVLPNIAFYMFRITKSFCAPSFFIQIKSLIERKGNSIRFTESQVWTKIVDICYRSVGSAGSTGSTDRCSQTITSHRSHREHSNDLLIPLNTSVIEDRTYIGWTHGKRTELLLELSGIGCFARIADEVAVIVDPTHFPPVFMPSVVCPRSCRHSCGHRTVHTLALIVISKMRQ